MSDDIKKCGCGEIQACDACQGWTGLEKDAVATTVQAKVQASVQADAPAPAGGEFVPVKGGTIDAMVAATEARVRAEVCQTTWMKAMACFPAASFCGGDWENAWNGALQEVEIRMRAAIAKDGIEIVDATLTSLPKTE